MSAARLLPGLAAAPPIGLELDGGRARAVQWRGRPAAGPAPAARIAVRRPDPGTEATGEELARLAAVMRRRGFRGRAVSLAVPGPGLLLETLELPPPESGAPLAELARAELAAMHRTTPESLVVDVVPLPAARGGVRRTLAAGCRVADLEPLLAAAREARLEVVHLTTAGLAAATALATDDRAAGDDAASGGADGAGGADPAPAGADVLVVAGWRWTELVVRRDGAVSSMRVLPELGLGAVAGSLAGRGAEPEECVAALAPTSDDPPLEPELERARTELVAAHAARLATEVARSLAYVEQEYGPAAGLRVRIAGAGAGCPGLAAAVAGRPEACADAAAGADVGDPRDSADDEAVWAVPRGLAADAAPGVARAGRTSPHRRAAA